MTVQRPKTPTKIVFEFNTPNQTQPDVYTLPMGADQHVAAVHQRIIDSGLLDATLTHIAPQSNPQRGEYPERIVVQSIHTVASQIAILNSALQAER